MIAAIIYTSIAIALSLAFVIGGICRSAKEYDRASDEYYYDLTGEKL